MMRAWSKRSVQLRMLIFFIEVIDICTVYHKPQEFSEAQRAQMLLETLRLQMDLTKLMVKIIKNACDG